ncbi:hypothetical protein, partial [Flavobacterium sp.]|uniref:hypothetical protein n=1 Tax=Flavobacterium sp. TaxID=239 RepID=UPI0038D02DCD
LASVPRLNFDVIAKLNAARKAPPIELELSQPKFKHYVGVQSNLLIRQVFNLSGTTSATNNPYLFTYAINNRKGWGLATGLGLTTSNNASSDVLGGFDKRSTQAMNVRLGIEKRFVLHPKWNALVGIDGLMNSNKSTSDVKTVQSFGTAFVSTSKTTDNSSSMGGALRAALSFAITSKLSLGTEASLAFTSGSESFSGTTSSDNGFGNNTFTTTSNTSSHSGFGMNVPTAFFVIIKF